MSQNPKNVNAALYVDGTLTIIISIPCYAVPQAEEKKKCGKIQIALFFTHMILITSCEACKFYNKIYSFDETWIICVMWTTCSASSKVASSCSLYWLECILFAKMFALSLMVCSQQTRSGFFAWHDCVRGQR